MTVLRRRTGLASGATLTGITLALGLAHAVAPDWSRRAGLDVWNAAAAEAAYQESATRAEELAAYQDDLDRMIGASDHVVDRLIDGRVSLRAATEELEQINTARSSFPATLATIYPDTRDYQEGLARYAVDKARRRLARDPARQAEVTARLEAELRVLRGPEGRGE